MKRLRCIGLLSALLAAALLCAPMGAVAAERDSISATGVAVTEAEPDMAYVYLRLEKDAATAEETRDGLARQIDSLKKMLRAQLIDEKDVKIAGYNFSPKYVMEKNKRVQKGYSASASANVKVKDLRKLSAVIDRGIEKSSAYVERVEFGLKDRNVIERRLLAEAVENAKQKAAIVAQSGGRALGALIRANISSSGGEARVQMNQDWKLRGSMNLAAEAVPTELAPGTITVRTSVSTEFALK